jgi:hypothetical protein
MKTRLASPAFFVRTGMDLRTWADIDSERAIRWLIALMVLCCDPLAIVLTAAASAQRIRIQ